MLRSATLHADRNPISKRLTVVVGLIATLQEGREERLHVVVQHIERVAQRGNGDGWIY